MCSVLTHDNSGVLSVLHLIFVWLTLSVCAKLLSERIGSILASWRAHLTQTKQR
jgi:hypothetical protein